MTCKDCIHYEPCKAMYFPISTYDEEAKTFDENMYYKECKYLKTNYKEKHKPTKCSCYKTELKQVVAYYDYLTGRPVYTKQEISRCNGTKERDVCYCGGDKDKCDFYKENRMRRIKNDIC